MGLRQKNLLYSMVLAGVMMLFLIGYFIYMLPSLYVEHVMEQNLRSIREQHTAYMEKGSYDGVRVKNATACFSVEIPFRGDEILIAGKAFSAQVTMRDERLRQILQMCREALLSYGDQEAQNTEAALAQEMEELGAYLQETVSKDSSLPVDVRMLYVRELEEDYHNAYVEMHSYSNDLIIIESGIEDSSNRYTNYIAVEQTDKSLVLSILPVVAPDAGEIRPVVLQSLPMLGAVILLLVLLFSQVYSRGIVGPIVELVRHAGEMKADRDFTVGRLSDTWSKRKDEVGILADTLDDFYLQIRESYRQLERKNAQLEEENQRQETFLRTSSHQLKTPIAAALLLVEGMMNEIGRYKDTKVYLPKVKEQLLSMRRMAEDILYLNHCAQNRKMESLDAGRLMQERLQCCQVGLDHKGIQARICGEESLTVHGDEMMLTQILDNLLSNAVKYTPAEGRIEITLRAGGEEGEAEIRIENYGVTIPEKLLPHILEPFVSGSHGGGAADSHGLGLYIASYFAKKQNFVLSVVNGEESVIAMIHF